MAQIKVEPNGDGSAGILKVFSTKPVLKLTHALTFTPDMLITIGRRMQELGESLKAQAASDLDDAELDQLDDDDLDDK